MQTIQKQKLNYSITEAILNEIQSGQARYYHFIGGIQESTAIPNSSQDYESAVRRNIALMKRITASDVCLVLPSISWVYNTVYSNFDSAITDTINNYYILAKNTFNVYKCVFSPRTPSTIQPSGTGVDPFFTDDGYKWKFMYNIPLGLRNKFLTTEYIPVANSLQNGFFSDGSIESITITDHGTNLPSDRTTLILTGDGTGAKLVPVIESGRLVSVNIINAGSGYTTAVVDFVVPQSITNTIAVTLPKITINLGLGDVNTPQSMTEALTIRGSIEGVIVDNAGKDYTTASATVVGDGTGATAAVQLSLDKKSITGISITNSGSDYTYATINIIGNGTDAAAHALVSPFLGHGRNAPKELGAQHIMFYKKLAFERYANISVNNEFRQYGIIRNPRNLAYGADLIDPAAKDKFVLIGSFSPSQYSVGDVLKTQTDRQFSIVSIQVGSQKNGMLVLAAVSGDVINSGDVISKVSNPAIAFVPDDIQQQSLVDALVASPCYVVYGTFNALDFPADTEVRVSVNSVQRLFSVVATNATAGSMMLLPKNGGKIVSGDTINKQNSSTSFTATSVTPPNIDVFTGELLFVDTREPVAQTADQSVTFRSVIKF